MIELIPHFRTLFAGCERAHGAYTVTDQIREDGKRQGKAVTKREHVTDQLWRKHLTGEQGLGIIPIRDDSTVVFGAIDIDAYIDFDPARLAAEVARRKLPLVVCRSKSGGAHVYCFSSTPVPAAQMQSKLREVAALLGHGNTEVFPKQAQLLSEQNDLGSWINMPYFDASATTRYAMMPDGGPMAVDEFLSYADSQRAGPEFFNGTLDAGECPAEFKDGPPCLATLVQIGFPEGSRNDGLYNVAVFVKRRFPDAWEKALYEYNERFMQPPLSSSEVQGVIGSFKRGKEYRYKCSQPPISPHCNPGQCRTRKYGVSGGLVPEFGPLTQQEGDTVFWFWSINGKRVRLTTDELFRFNKFRERCAEALRIVVPGMKQADWDGVISRAMETCEPIPATEDSTKAGALWELVEQYCNGPHASSIDDVLDAGNHPFHAEDGRTYFRLAGLMRCLQRLNFREMERGEVGRVLKQHGGAHHATNVGKGNARTKKNYWSVPTPAIRRDIAEPSHGEEEF